MLNNLKIIDEKINILERLLIKISDVISINITDKKILSFYHELILEISLLSKISSDIGNRARRSYEHSYYSEQENPFNGNGAEYLDNKSKEIINVLKDIEQNTLKFIDVISTGRYDLKFEDYFLNIFTIKDMLKQTYGKFGLVDEQLFSNLKSDINFNENKIRELSKSYKNLDNEFKELDSNYIDLNNKISDSFKKLSEINKDISVIGNEFSTYKTSINEKLSEFLVLQKKSIDSQLTRSLSEFNSKLEMANTDIKTKVEKVEKTSKSFNEFISDETSIKLTNNFKEKSENEKKWYYGFNIVSGIAIIFAICMSYFSLTDFADNHSKNFTQLDLYYLGIRLLFSFLIFSTVAFTNKLANKHYYHWKKNESTYLKLTALKSFIADMSPEKQQEIHEKLIDVYFGKEDLDPTIYKKMDNSSNDLIKFFTDKGLGLANSKKND